MPKKSGLNYEDVNYLVRCVREGMTWEDAKRTLINEIESASLDGWKDEVLRRASHTGPLLPGPGGFAEASDKYRPEGTPALSEGAQG